VLPSILQQETRVAEPQVGSLRQSPTAERGHNRKRNGRTRHHHAFLDGVSRADHGCPECLSATPPNLGSDCSRSPRRPPTQAMEIARARGLMPPITGDKRTSRADHWLQNSLGCDCGASSVKSLAALSGSARMAVVDGMRVDTWRETCSPRGQQWGARGGVVTDARKQTTTDVGSTRWNAARATCRRA
jgi:hypothetical protein